MNTKLAAFVGCLFQLLGGFSVTHMKRLAMFRAALMFIHDGLLIHGWLECAYCIQYGYQEVCLLQVILIATPWLGLRSPSSSRKINKTVSDSRLQ